VDSLEWNDVTQGLLKPFVLRSPFRWSDVLDSRRNPGVGHATTQAMVVASVLCFILTFFITKIFVSTVTN
jgi:ABC-type transporter Mla maintaining outer membrane lipid asymmetry permease subunit MlaE